MQLIHCPVCNNQCSPMAATCPKCGHPFQKSDISKPLQPKPKQGVRQNGESANIWKILTIATGIFLVGVLAFAGYRFYQVTNPDKTEFVAPNITQFITKDSYVKAIEVCIGSKDRICALRPFEEKVNKYCSDQKLPKDKCEKILILVGLKALEYHDQYNKEYMDTTDKIKRLTEDLKRGK